MGARDRPVKEAPPAVAARDACPQAIDRSRKPSRIVAERWPPPRPGGQAA